MSKLGMKHLAAIPFLLLAACGDDPDAAASGGSTDIENAFRGVMQDRSSTSAEEALYVEKCSMCHRQMGMGTVLLGRRVDPAEAMLEQRDNLTAEYIVAAARQGIGNMPRISKAEVSDEQMDTIVAYLLETGAGAAQ